MPAIQHHNTSSAKTKGSRQVFQNKTRFNPNRYQPEKQLPAESIRSATSLCCRRCQLIIQWKLDYGKYPTMVVIRKSVHACGVCGERSVNIPFHHVCQPCAEKHAVCAKCHLTAEESDLRALNATRRDRMNDEDAEYYAQLERDSDDDGEADEQDSDADKDEEELEAQKIERDKMKALEEEHPELVRLKGLDISVIRYNLEQSKKNSALSLISQQGKLRERERRSALRKLNHGDERGALEIAHKAIASRGGNDDDDDDDDDDDENDSDDENENENDDENSENGEFADVPVKQMTKDSRIDLNKISKKQETSAAKQPLRLAKAKERADDTPSDEETL